MKKLIILFFIVLPISIFSTTNKNTIPQIVVAKPAYIETPQTQTTNNKLHQIPKIPLCSTYRVTCLSNQTYQVRGVITLSEHPVYLPMSHSYICEFYQSSMYSENSFYHALNQACNDQYYFQCISDNVSTKCISGGVTTLFN